MRAKSWEDVTTILQEVTACSCYANEDMWDTECGRTSSLGHIDRQLGLGGDWGLPVEDQGAHSFGGAQWGQSVVRVIGKAWETAKRAALHDWWLLLPHRRNMGREVLMVIIILNLFILCLFCFDFVLILCVCLCLRGRARVRVILQLF